MTHSSKNLFVFLALNFKGELLLVSEQNKVNSFNKKNVPYIIPKNEKYRTVKFSRRNNNNSNHIHIKDYTTTKLNNHIKLDDLEYGEGLLKKCKSKFI